MPLRSGVGPDWIFLWKSVGDVHNIIWVGFCKTTQTSGNNNCQLEKKIACLYDPGKNAKTEMEILW